MRISIDIDNDMSEESENMVLDNELNNSNFINLRIGGNNYLVPLFELLTAVENFEALANRERLQDKIMED